MESSRHLGLVLAEQASYSVGNVAFSVAVARVCGAEVFGVVSVFLVAHAILLTFCRGLFSEVRLTTRELDKREITVLEIVGAVVVAISGLSIVAIVLDLTVSVPILGLLGVVMAYEILRIHAARMRRVGFIIGASSTWAIAQIPLLLAGIKTGLGCADASLMAWAILPTLSVLAWMMRFGMASVGHVDYRIGRAVRLGIENVVGTGAGRIILILMEPKLGLVGVGRLRLVLAAYGPVNSLMAGITTYSLSQRLSTAGPTRVKVIKRGLGITFVAVAYGIALALVLSLPAVTGFLGLGGGLTVLTALFIVQKAANGFTVPLFAARRRTDPGSTLSRRILEGVAVIVFAGVGTVVGGEAGFALGAGVGALVGVAAWVWRFDPTYRSTS